MLTDRDYLARFERPLPKPDALSAARIRYMREGARLMVRLIALDATMKPAGDHASYVEALGYVQCFGFRCKASNAEIISATQAEWHGATSYCSHFTEALRRALWWRCKAHQPEAAIIEAAENVAIGWNIPISNEQLMTLIRRIWTSAIPRRRHVR